MKKRLLSLLLALTLCLALLPGVALAATSVTNEQQLRDAVASGGEIQLVNTITINSTLTIESGKTVTLDLNGHVLKMDGSPAWPRLLRTGSHVQNLAYYTKKMSFCKPQRTAAQKIHKFRRMAFRFC